MYLFRFIAPDGTPHLGIEDDNGGRYDASVILPEAFASVGAWLAHADPLGAAQTVVAVGSDERRAGSTFYVSPDVTLLAPVDTSEVWASGVTYERSKSARMEESKESGGGDFYDRVYDAERPELFFKSVGWRVVGPGAPVRIRRDSTWNVPEPEMVLVLSAQGKIVGVTAGNDMSSRSIEGENPLYLPQAKTYDGACALGPMIRLSGIEEGIPVLSIALSIRRDGDTVFAGETSTARMKRTPEELAGWLFRETAFPHGAFLFTGTGVIPADEFTLRSGDSISITLEGVPMLNNTVA
ncbi:MAG: fumarylacetoacetate hydrolase family protein [Akkermansiaceae bacterium]|nr:fumarylacetoacetate hydrolase family protein [Armatimonadota bacterium]